MNDEFITKATEQDIDELVEIYDDLCDYLMTKGNPAGWEKGRYPVRQVAQKAFFNDTLYILNASDGNIAASMSIDNVQPEPYSDIDWNNKYSGKDVVVFHTLVVNPKYIKMGYGRKLVEFAIRTAKCMQAKCIRFDTYRKNLPAQKLYLSMGFEKMGLVDLKMNIPELDYYETFQMIL